MSVTPTLITKLMPPQTGTSVIDRPRLIDSFSKKAGWRIVLFIAPAGYGKTVLMSQLAETISRPLVWYQLDSYDNDPVIFIQYLITGIRQHLPGFGEKVYQTVKQGNLMQRLRLLTTLLVNELNERAKEGLTLVLDDFHCITEPFLHQLVQEILDHLPENINFFIASRFQPPLTLTRSTLDGKVLNIKVAELRFTRQEIASLLTKNRHHSLSEDEIEQLEYKTAGWPVILRFISASPRENISLSNEIETKTIYEFLATEILNQQPEKVRSFLTASAVLDIITPQNCDLLLERNDSREILEFLEKQQLFLISLSAGGPVYQFHQLFRDFLIKQLGPQAVQLRKRAGKIAQQAGELDRAVEYFLAAGYDQSLNEMLKEASRKMLHQGRWQTVARWLDLLPMEALLGDPWLCLYKGHVEVYSGRLDVADKWVTGAVSGFTERFEEIGLRESQTLQARIHRCRGNYQQALEILEKLAATILPEEFNQRFDLPLEKSLCLNMTGRFKESEAVLEAALTVAEKKDDRYVTTHLLEGLGTVNYFLGNFHKALQLYKKAAQLSPDQILPSYYTQDSISTIYQDWGEFDQAFEYAKRSVAIKEALGIHEALPSAYLQLASICEDRDDLASAENYYQKATNLLRENGEWFYLVLNLAFWARCLGTQGRWVEARALAEEALSKAQALSGSLALAVCQVVIAPIFIQTGSVREGAKLLHKGIASFEAMDFLKALSYGYANLAWFYLIVNDRESAFQSIEKSLQIASQINFFQYFLTYRAMLLPALKLALERGAEVTFIQRILVRMGVRSLDFLAELANDPDPLVRARSVAPLLEIGGPQAKKIINFLLRDREPEVRELTRRAANYSQSSFISESSAAKSVLPLQIKMLGSFQLINGTNLNQVKWRTLKTRDLLAYLIHHGEAVSKERILEDLWPDTDLKNATDLFHATTHYLRQLLMKVSSDDAIIYSNKCYQIVLNNSSSDRQEFQHLIAANSKSPLDRHAAVSMEKAVTLYRDDYLVELDYSWLIPEREHLRRLYLEARLLLSRYYLQTAEYPEAVNHLKTLEEVSPLSEEVHCLLMTVFAKSGNHSACREQYHKLVKILKKELGIMPSSETVELYQRLRSR